MSIKELIDLYKIHNPDAGPVDIHYLLRQFGLSGIVITHPNSKIARIEEESRQRCMILCKEHIIENSKLTKTDKLKNGA